MKCIGMILCGLCFILSACDDSNDSPARDALIVIPPDQALPDSATAQTDASNIMNPDAEPGPTGDAGSIEPADAALPEGPRPLELMQVSDINIQPDVAIGTDGRIGVTWCENGADNLGIGFALLSPNGELIAAPYPLDTERGGVQNEPVICALSEGGYAVAWSMDSQTPGAEGQSLSVRFRLIGPDGQPQMETDQVVDSGSPGNHWLAEIACDPNGGFLIVGSNSEPNGTFGVFAQRYGADGSPQGPTVQMNAHEDGGQTFPSVAIDRSGSAVIAWEDHQGFGTPEETYGITARRLNPDEMSPAAPEISIIRSMSEATRPVVSVDPETGRAVIAATQSSGRAVLFELDPDDDTVRTVNVSESGTTYYPTLTSLGQDAHLVLYLDGVRDDVNVRVRRYANTRLEGPGEILADGNLPPYSASITSRDGQTVAAWTERGPDNTFYVRIARLP